jgi:isopentenyldiphosphate isomerase
MTDPDELLEVYDEQGRPTGVARTRRAIHLDGDWHLAFFCWIFRAGPAGLEVVLQRRSERKDVWPGRFDASAAGHVRFGESREERAREIEEELGLSVELSELVSLPTSSHAHYHPNGLIDREHHDLYLLRCDLPLDAYRPNPLEVSGLTSVSIDRLLELRSGERAGLEAALAEVDDAGTLRWSSVVLRRQDLVPYEGGYFQVLAVEARRLLSRPAAS